LVQEREEEASKVRAILSSIADGVLVQDRDGHIIETNRAADKIIQQLQDPYPDPVQAIVANVPTVEEEIRRFMLANQTFDARTAYVITQQNEILGSVVVLRDITLEVESEKLKRKFIEAISHELLTPLVPIKGYLNLLTMISQGEEFSRHQTLIDTVGNNVEDLHNLVSTLVDVSQIEAGELSLDSQKFDFNELVSRVGESYQEKMGDENLTFRIHLTDAPLTVEGDRHRLQRVLRGLLENALYYNLPEGKVDLYLTQENGNARVDIVDTGTGIEESLKPYIFKTLFVRGAARGPDTVRGTGAQLYLARVIVEEHKGQIWFESNLNQGSTFSFIIPLCSGEYHNDMTHALNDGGHH
jgi:two-component system sensor histidine kinase ResE